MIKKAGDSIRDTEAGITVLNAKIVAEIGHKLRYVYTDEQVPHRFFLATVCETLAGLAAAKKVYGYKAGEKHIRDVLKLMMADLEERIDE